eukprot:gene5064-biopygen9318
MRVIAIVAPAAPAAAVPRHHAVLMAEAQRRAPGVAGAPGPGATPVPVSMPAPGQRLRPRICRLWGRCGDRCCSSVRGRSLANFARWNGGMRRCTI